MNNIFVYAKKKGHGVYIRLIYKFKKALVNDSTTATRSLCNTGFDPLTGNQYNIVDVVLYIATESTILAFFHTATGRKKKIV